MASTMTYRT